MTMKPECEFLNSAWQEISRLNRIVTDLMNDLARVTRERDDLRVRLGGAEFLRQRCIDTARPPATLNER